MVAYPESNSLLEWDRVSNQVPKISSKGSFFNQEGKNENSGLCWDGEFLKKVVSEMEPEPWGLVTPICKRVDASSSGTSWRR